MACDLTKMPPGAKPATINITPTWRGLLPALVALLRDGTEEGKKYAETEIRRMAEAADIGVRSQQDGVVEDEAGEALVCYVATYGPMGLDVEFFDDADAFAAASRDAEKRHDEGRLDTWTYGEVKP